MGWSRLAEVQAEVGWLAEAARAPLVYATAVLERLCATGVPSRAEVTDAACASRAECVLLNKGAFAREALELLADIVHRTHSHERKRMGLLRRLRFGR